MTSIDRRLGVKALRVVVTLALVAWALATLGFVAWLRERYGRSGPIPVSQAGTLLNPLRRFVMPVRETLEFIGLRRGQAVLELGPGPGYYTTEASRMVGKRGRLVCLDVQRGMLDILKARLAENGVTSAEMVAADATRLPLATGSVDLAFLITVLGEIPDRPAALTELRRVLKPCGTLAFGESLGDPDYVFQASLRDLCRAMGFEEIACRRDMMGYTMTFRAPL